MEDTSRREGASAFASSTLGQCFDCRYFIAYARLEATRIDMCGATCLVVSDVTINRQNWEHLGAWCHDGFSQLLQLW